MGCIHFEVAFGVQAFTSDHEIREFASYIQPPSFKHLDECTDDNIRDSINSLLEINPKKRPSAATLHKNSATKLWQSIGDAWKEKGKLEVSIKAYKKGTETDSSCTALWKGLVDIYEAKEAAVRQDLAEADRLRAEQETILHHLQDENAKLERENNVHIKAVKEISDLQEKNRALQSQIGEIDISVANLKKERDILEKEKSILQERLQWHITEKDQSNEKLRRENEELKQGNERLSSSIAELTNKTQTLQEKPKATSPSNHNLPRLLPKSTWEERSKAWSSSMPRIANGICSCVIVNLI